MAQVDRLEWGRTTRQAVFTKTLGQTTHIPKDQSCVFSGSQRLQSGLGKGLLFLAPNHV